MKDLPLIALAAVSVMMTGGCKSAKDTVSVQTDPVTDYSGSLRSERGRGQSQFMPKAVVYRTNGDYNSKVPVSLSPDGKSLVTYPAPDDVSEALSSPVKLSDGWLLDRRGIGANTAFLKYTYKEYSELKATPSVSELMDAIIPGAKVAEAYQLPINASEAASDPSVCLKYISDGFSGCRRL